MKTKFFFFLAMLLMSSVGAFAQSETNTPLKGDLNEDGEVNAADVVVLVDIIMKKNVDPNKYYWYIGAENPTSISNIQTDPTIGGWHEIGSSVFGFRLDTDRKKITVSTTERVCYYVIIPDALNIYDSCEDDASYAFDSAPCNINGYKAYKYNSGEGVWTVRGIVIKEIAPKFYWYIGTDNPSSISSNIQTGNTVAGWHEIGASIYGFNLSFDNSNKIEFEAQTAYYLIIPYGLTPYSVDETTSLVGNSFSEITCNISGYKAYQYHKDVYEAKDLIIKENQGIKYWYIGAENPTSISDIQTDKTVGGWHEIGSSLSGFELDTNSDKVTVSTTDRVLYYVIIPEALNIYDSCGADGTYVFDSIPCNINGYKAYKYNSGDGVWTVRGIIIK